MKLANDRKARSDHWFDYLVVGAGSAGCAAAAGLARAGHSVCIIEAGGAGNQLVTRMPLANAFQVPRLPGRNNWALSTRPQAEMAGRCGYQPRGKCVGGSSAINGMIYIRGRPQDYDAWEALGCTSWGWADVLPVFRALEKGIDDDHQIYGGEGPIHISKCQSRTEADAIFLDAAVEAGLTHLDDFNASAAAGVGPFRFTQFSDGDRAGHRCSAAEFINALPADNRPQVETGVVVKRLLLDQNKVVGVVGHRRNHTVFYRARYEVVLAAGTFGSPTILQRSGFGQPEKLKSLGINVRKSMTEIGANLQDHLQCGLHYKCNDDRFMGLTPRGMLELFSAARQWKKTGKGWGSTCFTQSGGFWKTKPDLELPDVQCHFFSGVVRDHGNRLHLTRGYSAHVYILNPASRGYIEITSKDHTLAPQIDPQYLSEPDDLDRLAMALKQLQNILNQPSFRALLPRPIADVAALDPEQIRNYIREHADTAYHPVGTCRMGNDEDAIVDPQLRFRGALGLRIADASIMPKIISANTNSASMMIGCRAAAFALNECAHS
ncbi:MAG: GMC family oxidoreductase N-terminal domain-containing protein [Pseudomonadota bacterium]